MATTETPWCGSADDKLYLASGQFETTLKDSQDISGVDTTPNSIEWDGTNSAWTGTQANKMYLQSGKFDAQLKTSFDPSISEPTGISWDGTNTPLSIAGASTQLK